MRTSVHFITIDEAQILTPGDAEAQIARAALADISSCPPAAWLPRMVMDSRTGLPTLSFVHQL